MFEAEYPERRLEEQINWYDTKSSWNQSWFKCLRVAVLALGASLPLLAGFGTPPIISGIAGAAIVVIEGVQHLFQFQHHWITYRATCEALRHEKYLFLAAAGPYAGSPVPRSLLAERVESLVSGEHAKWVAANNRAGESTGAVKQVT